MIDAAPPRPTSYVYAVVEQGAAADREILAVRLSRRDARDYIHELPEEEQPRLRVRRARLTLYER